MIAPDVVDEAMALYVGPGGAPAAAEHAGVSTRTVKRWARRRGLVSGWVNPPKVRVTDD